MKDEELIQRLSNMEDGFIERKTQPAANQAEV
jgi:hypothetical protein